MYKMTLTPWCRLSFVAFEDLWRWLLLLKGLGGHLIEVKADLWVELTELQQLIEHGGFLGQALII